VSFPLTVAFQPVIVILENTRDAIAQQRPAKKTARFTAIAPTHTDAGSSEIISSTVDLLTGL
jgi:hypothetical protein